MTSSPAPIELALIIGSLQKKSVHRAIAAAAAELVPDDVHLTEVPIGEAPFYNQDIEDAGEHPAVARMVRDFFVHPERRDISPVDTAGLNAALGVVDYTPCARPDKRATSWYSAHARRAACKTAYESNGCTWRRRR